jgi:hypothetical protein
VPANAGACWVGSRETCAVDGATNSILDQHARFDGSRVRSDAARPAATCAGPQHDVRERSTVTYQLLVPGVLTDQLACAPQRFGGNASTAADGR